ncbi:MAG: sulfite exporter TauE/SafE family protein [Verrucomicrobiaceae bacterium]|nr:MAG: sulfite exporter TauE/SafE family protein [Verrucomicrobiaceae bacterium]
MAVARLRFQPRAITVMKLVILATLTGLAAGLLGALCGVGGGIVMVPAFVGLLGLEHKQAVATSMAVIIVTAIAATLNNARANNLIDWKIVAAVGLASAVAAWFGSDLMRSLGNQTLTRIFGVLLVVFGLRMLWKA